MKKKLLGVLGLSALVLMTSCDKQELANVDKSPEAVNGKGIVFQIAETPGTKAEFDEFDPATGGQFGSKWYADYDRIGIIFNSNSIVMSHSITTAPLGVAAEAAWYSRADKTTNTSSHVNQFKASASGKIGYFVASCDDDVLKYAAEGDVKFRAFWSPVKSGSTWDATFTRDATSSVADGKVVMPTLSDQIQLNAAGNGISEKGFMYSETSKKVAAGDILADNSISKDRLSLSFNHAHPFVYFKITSTEDETNAAYIAKYGKEFERYGKLKSVKMESKGSTIPVVAASKLDYGNATFNMIGTTLSPKAITVDATAANLKSDITVKMGDGTPTGLAWSNDYYAFMAINNIDRKVFRDATPAAKDALEITYAFENIVLLDKAATNEDWAVTVDPADASKTTGVWRAAPKMEIENLPYIVFKDKVATTDFVLQLNTPFPAGTLASIVVDGTDANAGKKVVIFGGVEYLLSDIIGLISKVDLTDADYATVNKFTALTDVTLLKETSLPAGAFSTITTLRYLNLPLVSEVKSTALNSTSNALEQVYMPSFNFSPLESKIVRDNVLKEASLKKADVSGSDYIGLSYIQEKLSFENFVVLESAVIAKGVELGEGAFKDCKKLKEVNFEDANPGFITSSLGAKVGNYIFQGCEALVSVKLPSAMVILSEGLFKDCDALTTITGVENVTTIMKGAFSGCVGLTYMNAAKASIIETDAFSDCTKLVKNNSAAAGLTFPELLILNERTFKGCTALVKVKLPKVVTVNCVKGVNATTPVAVTDAPFAGTNALDEIECASIFTVNGLAAFKDAPATVKLYVNKDQQGVGFDLKSFDWTDNSVKPAEKRTTTFKAIARITY
ncbi:MAG: leucine-rich repeat domain-containing protein [Bacteroidales bacterium]